MTRHRHQTSGTGGAAVSAGASPALHDPTPQRSAKTVPPFWITSSTDHREHAIADQELASGQWHRSGIYRACAARS